MRNKKEVSISLGSIILFLLVAIIIFIGIYVYKTINGEKLDSLKTGENEELFLKEGKSIELELDNDQVKKIIEKISFPTHAVASLYNTKGFDLDTIENDLILRLGWAKVEKELIQNDLDNVGEYKETATKEEIEKSITKIFGKNVEYDNDTFNNIDVPIFYGYEENQGKINYKNNEYIANYIESTGGDIPFIHQQIEKVLKYNNKIEVYVKTAFIDTEYDEGSNKYEYIIYKDFKNNKFSMKLTQMDSLKFIETYSSKESAFKKNGQIDKISNKLNTYVYTFVLDEADKEYYLNEFNIEE